MCLASSNAEAEEPAKPEDLFEMSLEELMNVEIISMASLTSATRRLQPSAVTTITEADIQASGARSLYELLDIYVPNLQWIRNPWEADNLGLRGIINGRDDKYLLLVNGRVMNERTHYGAVSEKDLVLLKDIHHIDVIRGPGSALYGPGAVSMVINIVTHNAQTFQGTDITTKVGAVEEFYSTEIRHGRKEDDGFGFFWYAGIGSYVGADKYHAQQHYGFDFPSQSQYPWWNPDWGVFTGPPSLPADGTRAGEPLLHPNINRDGAMHRDLPPLKFFAQAAKDQWDLWLRYTRGGRQMAWDVGDLARVPWGWTEYGFTWDLGDGQSKKLMPNSFGYQQLTGYIGYTEELGAQTALDLAVSYDMMDYERYLRGMVVDAYREDEYYGKAMIRHDISQGHKAALGFEVSHHELGFASPGWPHLDNPVNARIDAIEPMPRWSSNLYSMLGEYQWEILPNATVFIGGRIDDHSNTDQMFSPRAALVLTPTEQDTYKLMWSRSVRANFEEEMKAQMLSGGSSSSQPEKLDSVELRYERQETKNLTFAASLFSHYNLELITYDGGSGATVPVATQKEWGIELEADYRTDKNRFSISHGYTKLVDFILEEGMETNLSVHPYGYGDDLANWANHITKITAQHKLDSQWTLDSSLRIYWDFPGLKDAHDYYTALPDAAMNAGWNDGSKGNFYLNLGLQYQPNKDLTFRIDGYNLLGVFDEDLNKRNYIGENGTFRSHAPAAAVTMTYRF